MSFLLLKQEFTELLHREGLREFADFFRVASRAVVSGHHARNCVRIDIGSVRAFLKREHFIPWKDYVQSSWAGFGFVSKSRREWNALHALKQFGIACPEPLAVGQSGGRAFLLVRDLADAVDLNTFLRTTALSSGDRAWLATLVGKAISELHAAGFNHPDLYAKHLFLDRNGRTVSFIDFQRTVRRRRVNWRQRWRDLAALHVSLTDDLASPRERLRCLFAYVRHALQDAHPKHAAIPAQRRRLLRQAVEAIRRRSRRLLARQKIHWMRVPEARRQGGMVIEYWRVALPEPRTADMAVGVAAPLRGQEGLPP